MRRPRCAAVSPGCSPSRRPRSPIPGQDDARGDRRARAGHRLRDARRGSGRRIRRPPRRRRQGEAEAFRARRSLAFFAQLTDPADRRRDVAGARRLRRCRRRRTEVGAPSPGGARDADFDAVVRNVNANRRSPVADGRGNRAELGFALSTGDLADNQQHNETHWFRTVLDGGRVDPFSGKPVGAGKPCAGHRPRRSRGSRRRRRARLCRRAGLRRLARRARGSATRATRIRTAAPSAGAVRGVPALPGPDGSRAGAVRRRRAGGSVVRVARQPRRPDPGQRAGRRRSLPLDRGRLPEGVPDRRGRPRAVRRRDESVALRRLRRAGVHRARCSPAKLVPPDPKRRIIDKARVPSADGAGKRHRARAWRRRRAES